MAFRTKKYVFSCKSFKIGTENSGIQGKNRRAGRFETVGEKRKKEHRKQENE